MNTVTRVAIETWRSVAGKTSTLETYFRHRRRSRFAEKRDPPLSRRRAKALSCWNPAPTVSPERGSCFVEAATFRPCLSLPASCGRRYEEPWR